MLNHRTPRAAAPPGSGPRRASPVPPPRLGDRGTALLLLPAVLLVVLVLGAIAVDATVRHLAAHQAVDAAAAAASDAVTVGLDEASLRGGAGYRLDPSRARRAAERAVAARSLRHRVVRIDVAVGPGPDEVSVEVVLEVAPVLAGALPGGGTVEVRGRARAVADRR